MKCFNTLHDSDCSGGAVDCAGKRTWPTYPMHECKCRALANGQIVYCPLHAAAEAMLEFVQIVADEHHSAGCDALPILTEKRCDCVKGRARALLAKVGG